MYRQLDHTPQALRYAQVAMESLTPPAPAVRQLDDTPLTELVMNNRDTTRRAVNRVLGSLLSLPEDERTMLLTTARAWLRAHGSAAVTAQTLHCHQNTVRYRMHRLEEHLRGPLTDPRVVAELSLALDAVGTFPSLLESPHTPWASPRTVDTSDQPTGVCLIERLQCRTTRLTCQVSGVVRSYADGGCPAGPDVGRARLARHCPAGCCRPDTGRARLARQRPADAAGNPHARGTDPAGDRG